MSVDNVERHTEQWSVQWKSNRIISIIIQFCFRIHWHHSHLKFKSEFPLNFREGIKFINHNIGIRSNDSNGLCVCIKHLHWIYLEITWLPQSNQPDKLNIDEILNICFLFHFIYPFRERDVLRTKSEFIFFSFLVLVSFVHTRNHVYTFCIGCIFSPLIPLILILVFFRLRSLSSFVFLFFVYVICFDWEIRQVPHVYCSPESMK